VGCFRREFEFGDEIRVLRETGEVSEAS